MALVDIHTGKNRIKYTEYVVVGDEAKGCKLGDIRWVQWDRHKSSPMLEVFWVDPKTRTRVGRIQLAPEFEKRGWRLLRDMYEAEPAKRKHWEDWEAFCKAQKDNPAGMKGLPFKDEYLPDALLEMRRLAAIDKVDRTEFVFPSEAREAAEAAEQANAKALEDARPKSEAKPSARTRKASA